MINETLHTFISVTKNGSFNKAAEKLSLTAPAVMKQMNSLEKSIGAPLFERTNRGIRLTPAGESFLKDAKTILRYTRKSIERAQIASGQTPHLPTCGAQKAGSVHPAAPLPTDREERNRRESARRHADIAEAQGKSAEEIHEIFKKVMEGTGKCSGKKEEAVSKCHGHYPIPEDEEGKKRYESALRHVAIAKENGKSVDELHAIFKKVMEGTGKCSGRKQ